MRDVRSLRCHQDCQLCIRKGAAPALKLERGHRSAHEQREHQSEHRGVVPTAKAPDDGLASLRVWDQTKVDDVKVSPVEVEGEASRVSAQRGTKPLSQACGNAGLLERTTTLQRRRGPRCSGRGLLSQGCRLPLQACRGGSAPLLGCARSQRRDGHH